MNKSDSATAVNFHKTDSKFMPPVAKATTDRNNILHVMSVFMKSGIPKFSLKTLIVWGNNEMLISEDEGTFTDKKDKEFDNRKSLMVWKIEIGNWKMFRDCYNSYMLLLK